MFSKDAPLQEVREAFCKYLVDKAFDLDDPDSDSCAWYLSQLAVPPNEDPEIIEILFGMIVEHAMAEYQVKDRERLLRIERRLDIVKPLKLATSNGKNQGSR